MNTKARPTQRLGERNETVRSANMAYLEALAPALDYRRRKEHKDSTHCLLLTAHCSPLTAHCPLPTAYCLLRIVSSFASGHGIWAIDVDADSAPRSVAHLVCRAIGQGIERTQVGNHAIISAGQVLQLFAFIEGAAAYVRQLLHPIVCQIESLLLNIFGAQGFVALRVRPDRIYNSIKLFCPSDQFLVRKLRTFTRNIRHHAVQAIAHYDNRVTARVPGFAEHFIHGKGQRVVKLRTTFRLLDGTDALAQGLMVVRQRRNHYLPTGKGDYTYSIKRPRGCDKMEGRRFDQFDDLRSRA